MAFDARVPNLATQPAMSEIAFHSRMPEYRRGGSGPMIRGQCGPYGTLKDTSLESAPPGVTTLTAVDGAGDVYVGDIRGARVQKFVLSGAAAGRAGSAP
jgi:hypothetical protein